MTAANYCKKYLSQYNHQLMLSDSMEDLSLYGIEQYNFQKKVDVESIIFENC